MPKYKLSTERRKAQALIKPILKANFNQTEVARQLGVKPQTINEQFHSKPVQDALDEYFDSDKAQKKVRSCIDKGLAATRGVYRGKKRNTLKHIPDHYCRHKFVNTYLQATGRIKDNGQAGGNQYIQINYGYRQPKVEHAGN